MENVTDSSKNEVTIIDNRDEKGRFKQGNNWGVTKTKNTKQTLIMKQFMNTDEFIVINKKAIELAMGGDTKMIELFMKPLIPKRSSAIVYCAGVNEGTAKERLQAILNHVNNGFLTPDEGERLSNIVDKYTRNVEIVELSNKIDLLMSEKEKREQEK
jgi:hypothetical protein